MKLLLFKLSLITLGMTLSQPSLALTYHFTGQISQADDRTGFLQGDMDKAQVVGVLEIPDDYAQAGSKNEKGSVSSFSFDEQEARLHISINGHTFESDPKNTRILVQLENSQRKPRSDHFVIRSYNNIFKSPGSKKPLVSDENHISIQLDDSSMKALAQVDEIPTHFNLSEWTQTFGLTISANSSKNLHLRAALTSLSQQPGKTMKLSLFRRIFNDLKSKMTSLFGDDADVESAIKAGR